MLSKSRPPPDDTMSDNVLHTTKVVRVRVRVCVVCVCVAGGVVKYASTKKQCAGRKRSKTEKEAWSDRRSDELS